MIDVLVHAPEDFGNLCVLTRTLECLGIERCNVFDPKGLVRPRYGKSYRRRQRSLSAGAFERVTLVPVEDSLAFIQTYPGRTVATSPASSATPLTAFQFRPDDLLVLGPEGAGLPEDILSACSVCVTIPQHGATVSLNLVVAAGILLFEAQRQLGIVPQ